MSNRIGISLGWNCNSAVEGVKLGIRATKHNGYKTCPFDEMVTNYQGIIQCLNDDFIHFVDTAYLDLVQKQENAIHINSIKKDEKVIRNNYYHFIFNHESPGHGDLYLTQNWSGGINHFINNDYEEFKKRYSKRIENFRSYINDPNNIIVFILHRYNTNNDNINELHEVLHRKYPNLVYEFHFLDVQYDPMYIKEHFILLGLNESDEEIKRLYL